MGNSSSVKRLILTKLIGYRKSMVLINCTKAKKKKSLVSGYPTKPNNLGPTQTFLKTFRILKSIFRLFLRIFILFPYKKVLIKKKFAYLTTLKILDM